MDLIAEARQVAEHYGLAEASIEPLGTGLINETLLLTAAQGGRFVLQRLNAIFPAAINLDIDELTRHLDAAGQLTLRLVQTQDDGALWVERGGRIWRMSTFVPGACYDKLQSESQAAEAGGLLADFHRSLMSLPMELHNERLGVHDTARHFAALRTALEKHRDHRYNGQISQLCERILAQADALPVLPEMPDRLVHGDPKISNLLFDEHSGKGICLIDLDTLAYMPVALEMGDAFRSWCNPRGEDAREANFRLDFFSAAVGAYGEQMHGELQPQEWQSFVPATQTIIIELAARFATDALNESYFGWDASKFPDRSTHNQYRAEGQLALYESFCAHAEQATLAVEKAFRVGIEPN